MDNNAEQVRSAVRDLYSALASVSTCCGSSAVSECSCSASQLYEGSLLGDLPVEVTGLALGCGDPVTIASLKPGETVLDLGSGGGIDCFLAARQVGETGHVIGVDMTPEMIARANSNRERVRATNVEFRQGVIENLPVVDSSVDVIISNCVINLSPDKAAVFREAYRVLKPGGRVSISDIVTEGSFSPEMRAKLPLWAECITGAIDVNEYVGIMQEAGFVDIEIVHKVETTVLPATPTGTPRLFSARIVAHKPM